MISSPSKNAPTSIEIFPAITSTADNLSPQAATVLSAKNSSAEPMPKTLSPTAEEHMSLNMDNLASSLDAAQLNDIAYENDALVSSDNSAARETREESLLSKIATYVSKHPIKTGLMLLGGTAAIAGTAYLLNNSSTTAQLEQTPEAQAQTSGAYTLTEDTILYGKNKGWFTMKHHLYCEKSGITQKPQKVTGSIIGPDGWDAFHIPKGSSGCSLSGYGDGWPLWHGQFFNRSITGHTHKQSGINGNNLYVHDSWGFSFAKQSGWQNPSGWKGSHFPMFQKDLNKCIQMENSYACRGQFKQPRQFLSKNRCPDKIQVTLNTEGFDEPWCIKNQNSQCLKISGKNHTGKHSWRVTFDGRQTDRGYGCNLAKPATDAQLLAWRWKL